MGRKSSDDRVYTVPSGGATYDSSVFYSSGSGTFTPPSGTKELYVWLTGAGGGGGMGGNNYNHGGGGASACTIFAHITDVAASYSYSVGTGGAKGTQEHVGGADGTNTTFGNLTANFGEGAVSHGGSGASQAGNGTISADGTIGNDAARGIKFRGNYAMPGGGGDADNDRPGANNWGNASFWGVGGRSGNLNDYTRSCGQPGQVWGSGGGASIKRSDQNTGTPGDGAPGMIYIQVYK